MPNTIERQLFVSVRIDQTNAVHTHITVFTAYGYSPEATRGNSGKLCLDTITAADFINRLQPCRITYDDTNPPDWIEEIKCS
jgi:hypothetical protein